MPALQQLKATLVTTAAWALFITGILHLLIAIRLKNRAVVLMYHRVIAREALEDIASHPGIVVETATFEKHLGFLRSHMNVVCAERFVECMTAAGRFPSRTCLITFDDGWEDNFTQAYPLLRKYELPALVFLAVGFIGTKARFWQETLIHALLRGVRSARGAPTAPLRDLLAKVGVVDTNVAAGGAGKAHIQDVVCHLKHSSEDARRELLDEAAAITGVSAEAARHADGFLSWTQVREMAAGGITFGSHSYRHELLTNVGVDDARRDLARSNEVLERELGRRPWAMSYPNGSQNTQVRRVVTELGYRAGFGTEAGWVDATDDRFLIRRINVHQGSSSTVPLLMARIAGVF